MKRFFTSKLFLFIFITVVIVILIGVSSGSNSKVNHIGGILNTALTPFQKFISFSSQKISSSMAFFSDVKTMRKENEDLKAKLYKLENENRDLLKYKDKITELQEALDLKDQFNDYDFIGANIIAKDMGNWFNIFTIDRGTKDGIASGYPVITGKGLVGRVISTGRFSSRIKAVIDIDSTVFGRISKTRDLVRIKGDLELKETGLCKMDYIPSDADISVGDTIETSGLGGIYPKGIIIGRITEVRQSGNELSRYAVVKPAVDFRRLEEVIILKSKAGEDAGSSAK